MFDEFEQFEDDPATAFLQDIDFDVLRKYIGPSVWEMHSIEDGFIVRSYVLGPDEE